MNGGAEHHAREMAHSLAPWHDVTVLTSCAASAEAWDLAFDAGLSDDGPVQVERFVHPPRHEGGRARVPLPLKLRWFFGAWLDLLRRPRVPQPRGDDWQDGLIFLRRQGPTCDGLVDGLRHAPERFDVVVFFTAIFFPTAIGLPARGMRSILVPLLHDEKASHLPLLHRCFAAAADTLYNTHAERRLAHRMFGGSAGAGQVVGTICRAQPAAPAVLARVQRQYALAGPYLVYVGRIERGKGCAELLSAWRAVAKDEPGATLVMVGRGPLRVDGIAGVRATGFVPAQDRDALVQGAVALVMPSRYESLSLVLIEAMALGVPVIANADCEVLADQVAASGAGEGYRGRRALRRALHAALHRPLRARQDMGDAGRRFAQRYSPEIVQQQWLDAVERAAAGVAPR